VVVGPRTATWPDDQIVAGGQCGARLPKGLANQTFPTIATRGRTDFARYRQPQPSLVSPIRHAVDDQHVVHGDHTGLKNAIEIDLSPDPARPPRSLVLVLVLIHP